MRAMVSTSDNNHTDMFFFLSPMADLGPAGVSDGPLRPVQRETPATDMVSIPGNYHVYTHTS